MKFSMTATTMAFTVMMLGPMAISNAQDVVSPPVQQYRAEKPATDAHAAVQHAKTLRASQLIGMNVLNMQGETIAEVNDLVLDPQSGKVRYAAVTYGGFLGMGDKMFAVPFEAFHWKQDPNDADERLLMLNVTEEQLDAKQGFDQDNWPNFADPQLTDNLDKQYRIDRRINNGHRGVDVDVNRGGVKVDVNP